VAALLRDAYGTDARFVHCDVSQEADVAAMMEEAAAMGAGSIDALVNVAGVDIIATLADTSLARWERALAVNLTSMYVALLGWGLAELVQLGGGGGGTSLCHCACAWR